MDPKADMEKLAAYVSKDYSETIEFPVELVDRDGVVRRYSYEESLAVYHRRIQSAPWRYSDDALIRAEIGHCSRRIDQIKRSYNARALRGDSAPTNPRAALGEGFGILHAHYEELLIRRGLTLDGPLPLELALLEDAPTRRVYHVGFGTGAGHLLYVHLLTRAGDDNPLLAFREAADSFRGRIAGPDVERLLLAEQTEAAGFLLTGTVEVPEGLLEIARPRDATPEAEPGDSIDWLFDGMDVPRMRAPGDSEEPPEFGAFEEGLDALREERAEQAVDRFIEAVRLNPYHREGYLALLAVLDARGRYEEAEFYGAMAARQLAGDGLVRYRQGINFVRQGRFGEAVAAFDDACRLAPDLYPPAYFAAHVLIAQGSDLDGAYGRLLHAAQADPAEPLVARSLAVIEACRRARRGFRILGSLCITFGGATLAFGGIGGTAAVVGGALLIACASRVTVWTARRAMQESVGPTEVPGE